MMEVERGRRAGERENPALCSAVVLQGCVMQMSVCIRETSRHRRAHRSEHATRENRERLQPHVEATGHADRTAA